MCIHVWNLQSLTFPKKIHIYIYLYFRSMYFDEDGDLAHEFYEEVVDKRSKKMKMRKKRREYLTPQVCIGLLTQGSYKIKIYLIKLISYWRTHSYNG